MALQNVKVVLNDDGIRQLLNSSGVQSFLRGEANQVSSSASGGGGRYEVEVTPGKVRSRAKIRTADEAARKASSEKQSLARAGYASGGSPGRG